MKESSLLISMFASYASCVNELKIINIKREEFINSIPGTTLQGISFEESTGCTAEKYRLSELSDDIEEWETSIQPIALVCINVVKMCDKWLLEMPTEIGRIFTLRFVDAKTLDDVAKSTGYTKGAVSKIIRNYCSNIDAY